MRSGGLFTLVAALVFLMLFALAERTNQGLLVQPAATQPPLVPAMLQADGHDWAENGSFAGGAAPESWAVFRVTEGDAAFEREAGAPYLTLRCAPGACVAGLMQSRDDLGAGYYVAEADVYLDPETAGAGLGARLGFDGSGGGDATAPQVLWSTAGRDPGWQRLRLAFDHGGGPGTVFVVFDRLGGEGECRIAGLRLLGPPPEERPRPMAVSSATPEAEVEPETRALYVAAEDLAWSGPEELAALMRRAADARFNVVFLQVRRLGYAYYTPGVEPLAPILRATDGSTWDPLAEAVRLAHDAGLELHAWVEVLPVWQGRTPPPSSAPEHMYNLFTTRFGADWMAGAGEHRASTTATVHAAPGHRQVRAYLVSLCRDVARRYEIDGLHLTSVGYPSLVAPVDEAEGRRAEVSALLGEIVTAAREERPDLVVTAAVWPVAYDRWGWGGIQGATELNEDGRAWLDGGVEALVPRLDVDPLYQAPERLTAIVADGFGLGEGSRLVPALAVEGTSAVALTRAVSWARSAGAGGVALPYAALEAGALWDDLAAGPFATPAAPIGRLK